jgi:hypothetical protein
MNIGENGMARATQLLAYHGRTALLVGPMPRRPIPKVANLSAPLRFLANVADTGRDTAMKSGSGQPTPLHVLLATSLAPASGASQDMQQASASIAQMAHRVSSLRPKDGRRGHP